MLPLRRHTLVHLSAPGWQTVIPRCNGAERQLLTHWSTNRLPLVVCTQPDVLGEQPSKGSVAVGLAAPANWDYLKLRLVLPLKCIHFSAAFPSLPEVARQMPPPAREKLTGLGAQLAKSGFRSQVFGSFGWQFITGLKYVHRRSDLDLSVVVASPEDADRVAALLSQCEVPGLRIDGEFSFSNGNDVSWREWMAFRAEKTEKILVRRLDRFWLEKDDFWSRFSTAHVARQMDAALP